MKNTIIFYKDWLPLINSLPEKSKLQFWELWSNYSGVDYNPVINDVHLKGVYDFIISQVKKADEKYNDVLEKRIKAGISSGKNRKNKSLKCSAKRTSVQSVEQNELNVNGNVNGNVDVDYNNYLSFLNSTLKKQFRGSESTKKSFYARLKDGYEPADFEIAIKSASKDQYHIENNFKYLTAEFFTRPDKLDKFINIAKQPVKPKTPIIDHEDFFGTKITDAPYLNND
jgi:uncharacterized phage protein (TIGR02220 family)